MDSLHGKVAVITEAASGLGMAQALRASGADVNTGVADVSDAKQVQGLAQVALQRHGGVDIVCNNAGGGAGTVPSWHSTLDDWQWLLGVNLMGVAHGNRSFMPILLKQGTPAPTVNTASMAGLSAGGNPSASPLPGMEDALRQLK